MNKNPLYIRPACFEILEDRIAPATIIVANLNDTGEGSLREAVNQANMDAEADTIKFSKGLSGTISLSSEIAITDSVTIVGPGSEKVSISGNNTNRIFNIDDGTAETDTVSISGLFLSKTKILNNSAANAGGGVSTSGAAAMAVYLASSLSVFQANKAGYGGGIDATGDGTLVIYKSKFNKNTTSSDDGGAMYLRTNSTIEIIASMFSGNSAADDGGAVALGSMGAFSITKSKFQKNTAGDSGGGIALFNGATTIDSSTIVGNSAGNKGGIASYATVSTVSSKISGNTAPTNPDIYQQ